MILGIKEGGVVAFWVTIDGGLGERGEDRGENNVLGFVLGDLRRVDSPVPEIRAPAPRCARVWYAAGGDIALVSGAALGL